MKYLYTILISATAVVLSSCTASRYYQSGSQEYYQPQSEITYQQFYNDLSPYGNWVNYGSYGYGWIPNQPNFRPYYSNGRWLYTNVGWTWVSDYSWGWAPFHYGRWNYDPMYGWIWIPGYEWAPAWVSWRGGGDYFGWAPLGPGMDAGMSMGSIPYNNWTFVPARYMNSTRMNNYYVNPSNNVTIINRTTIINNTTVVNNGNNGNYGPRRAYNAGPSVTEVERVSGTTIRQFNVVNSGRPSDARVVNNSVRVFRPAVTQTNNSNTSPAPQRVMDINEVRQMHDANPRVNRQNSQQPNNEVRQFPANQTPQVLKNEPPVRENNSPAVNQNRNYRPQRVFPNNPQRNNTQPPANNTNGERQYNPAENPNRTKEPVRTFQPHTNDQPNPNPQAQEPPRRLNNERVMRENAQPEQRNNASQPVRTFSKRNDTQVEAPRQDNTPPRRQFEKQQ